MKVRPRRHFTFALSGVGVLLYAVYRLWVGISNFRAASEFIQLQKASAEPLTGFNLFIILTPIVLGVTLTIIALLGISAFIRCCTGKKLIALAAIDGTIVFLNMILSYLLVGISVSEILFLLLDAFFIVFGVMWGRYQAARRGEDPSLPRRLFPFVREFGLYFTVDVPEEKK